MPYTSVLRENDMLNREVPFVDDGLLSKLSIVKTPESYENSHRAKMTDMRRKELAGELQTEPLLVENPGRFVLFPIQDNEVWQMYKKAEASFWTAEELDLAHDNKDWEGLSDEERHFVKHVLAF
ncbi:unnamed protein product, partial [Discosporangium mesarthrocarpum]